MDAGHGSFSVTPVPQSSPDTSAGSAFSFPGPSDGGSSAGEDEDEQPAVRKEFASPGRARNSLRTGVFGEEGRAAHERQQGRALCAELHGAVASRSAGDLADRVTL